MSRSGYSDDYDHPELWRAAVDRALQGARGQRFLHTLRAALDGMAVKRLSAGAIADPSGEVCALGAVDPEATVDPWDRAAVAKHFGIARAMAAEIAFVNDEGVIGLETPEHRWRRVRAWVEGQIIPAEGGHR